MPAFAQSEIQIFAGAEPIILSDQQVNIISEKSGTYIHGSVKMGVIVKSDLENFLSHTDFDGTTTFSGLTLPYQTSISIGSQTLIIQPSVASSALPFGLSEEDIVVGIVALVAIVILALVIKQKVVNR